ERISASAGKQQIYLAIEAVHLLQRLNRIALSSNEQSLSYHGVQIDELASSEKPIEVIAARHMPPYQLLECRDLVRRVMVHVHVGMFFPRRHDQVHHLLERDALFTFGECPRILVFQ